jgi:hypothetical protein
VRLAQSLWLRLREKGIRFLCVAIVANGAGLSCGYLLYKKLTPLLGILVVSIIGGIIHVFITYSSHYCITFRKPGNFLQGLWKIYITSWVGMLISSVLGQFLLGTLKLPFFIAQGIIFCVGAVYAVIINFLVVFREKPSVSAPETESNPSRSMP